MIKPIVAYIGADIIWGVSQGTIASHIFSADTAHLIHSVTKIAQRCKIYFFSRLKMVAPNRLLVRTLLEKENGHC